MGTKQPRNYRRRCNDEIDGKDATAAAKPSSSDLYSSKRRKLPANDAAKGRDHAKPSWRIVLPGGCSTVASDGSYTQEQKQQSLKEQSWDERPMEVVFNGEPLRSIGMNGLFHVFNCPMPQTDDDKKASLDRYFNAYDENVNSRNARTFKKGVGNERSHRTVSTSGIPLASMPIVSVPCTSVVDDALPDELAKKLKEPYAKTDENLTASLAAPESCPSAPVDKYVFMQELSDLRSVFRYFMQENGSLIKEIEDQMNEITERHASAILERRTAADDDEMVLVEAAVKAAMAALNKQGNSNSAIATSAASSSIRQQTNQPVQRREVEQKAAALQKRRARFENKRASAVEVDGYSLIIEGDSSTDESDNETPAYKETRDRLLECADKILSDASVVYSQLSRVKTIFKRCARDYPSACRSAYKSLTVPSIYSPYVRLELLRWDPLHQHVDFSDMNWHGLLFDYEIGNGFAPVCTDPNFVSELVEYVAIPILHHRIVRCWDILSTRETRNAVAATSLVASYVYSSSKALAKLSVALRARLVEAITAISVPTWDPQVSKAVPNAPQVAAYRFGTSVRLMRNICMWKDIMELPVLEKLALSDLLFGKVLHHVRSIASESNMHDAVTRTEMIVASLSGVWTGPSVTRTHSRLLQPLVDCTLTHGRILEKRLASGLVDTETTGLARRLKKILVELHEHGHAREIVRAFNLKEAVQI
ncbi:unnamed protein product [Arabidopsis arenosa]|uniref:GCF C-terminal domain-containing protein n=1 Tax=Arabidopsis arenosa TaxID=38785 RepID=A0A8S2AG47_ARAAE|nr:unnamed protein product [Arabidopsis arenosa]